MRHLALSMLLLYGVATACAAEETRRLKADPLAPEVYQQVQDHLRSLTVLGAQGPFFRDPEKRQAVADQLQSLDARQIEQQGKLKLALVRLNADDMRVICQLRSIEAFGLHHCYITADAFAVLAKAWGPSLQKLQLSYVTVEEGSIAESLGQLKQLTWLTINATRGVEIDALSNVARFDIIALDMNRLPRGMPGDQVIQLLRTEFKSLQRLDLHHWQKFREQRQALEQARPGLRGKLKGEYGF